MQQDYLQGKPIRHLTSNNHYKTVAYLRVYLSKSEDEYSQAKSESMKEAFGKQLDNCEQMKNVAHTYTGVVSG